MKDYLRWLVSAAEGCGADIRLDTPVTPELVDQLAPDAVIVATGSQYLRPTIPGIGGDTVAMLTDVERGRTVPGRKVLVCGGGSAGLECALGLAMEGHEVAVADQLPLEGFAAGMPYFPAGPAQVPGPAGGAAAAGAPGGAVHRPGSGAVRPGRNDE